ncbi:cytochrome c oxidase assembly factor Coa1 family protein [Flavobacterium silvaticum]|uniref:Cytochrome oxidase complex assembly protein 1 n=1 Tax=Flavobacterium silvaticum TaxID=1852020 RepID=A0A972G2N0_9FLAO|nr:cytochrome c oxidase assembly factor Coa1 family protein [Flavobacterium silvaticum]NMH29346.1 hypothetical protein [Flavobacterium silvaticum]
MDDLILRKSWFRRSLIWLVPLFFLVTFVIVSGIRSSEFSDAAMAYTENDLYENALQKANANPDVLQKTGKLNPLDKMAIFEGNTKYSAHKDSVAVTVRVAGEKRKAKMDVNAHKVNGKWHYDLVQIRIKEPAETIVAIK